VRELEARAGTRRRWRSVEGNVALRALAVVFVVGTHASLYRIQGGAHLLLAVAGFNFARFRLSATDAADRVRRAVGSMARIWVPAVLWVCFMFTWREPFTIPRLLLVDNVFGDGLWRYWYIEVLLQLLVVLTIVFGLGSMRDVERRRPFAFAMVLLVGALAVRYGLAPWALPDEPMYRTDTVAWLFLVGWAAARASQPAQKAAVTLAAIVAVPGFFDSAGRGLVVALGLLALVWLPRIRLPRPVNRAVAAIAGASLYIFLTHFAVLPWLRPHVPAWALLASALAVGIAVDAVAQHVRPVEWLHRRRPRAVATSRR
jgi:peptidoglycan/LPS O-acetylase OafA/YrhL